jgi:hypothetical protein
MTLKTSDLIRKVTTTHSKITCDLITGNVTRNENVTFNCTEHGLFTSTFDKVISSKYGCPHCKKDRQVPKLHKPHSHFLEKLIEANNGKYELRYTEPLNSRSMIDINCKHHGWSTVSLNSLRSGSGCRKCGYDISSRKQRKYSTDRVVEAWKVHGYFKYDYSLVQPIVTSNKVKIPIICNDHGIFYQRFNDHLRGKGCPVCANNTSDKGYVHLVKDGEINVCLKFGITRNVKARLSEIRSGTKFTVTNLLVWKFLNYESCRKAESEIKRDIEGCSMTKNYMNDGFTETCHVSQLDAIIEIFEKHGGKRVYD